MHELIGAPLFYAQFNCKYTTQHEYTTREVEQLKKAVYRYVAVERTSKGARLLWRSWFGHMSDTAEDRWSAFVNKSELLRAYIWGVKGSPGSLLFLRNKDLRGYTWCWRKRYKIISPSQTQLNSSICYSVFKIGKDSHIKICKNVFLF